MSGETKRRLVVVTVGGNAPWFAKRARRIAGD